MLFLAEVTAYDPAAAATRVMLFSTGLGYNDASAPGYYEARIVQPCEFSRSLFSFGSLSGANEVSFGNLILANPDGALDYMRGLGVAGWPVRILALQDESQPYSAAVVVMQGVAAQVLLSFSEAQIVLRDRLQIFTGPLQTATFAGNNALPNGYEGDSSMAGQPKPIVYGQPANCPIVLCNTSRLIYQLADVPGVTVLAAYDGGAPLTFQSAATSQSDFEGTTVTAGSYRTWTSGTASYVRLGANPAGQVTADLAEGANTAARTVAQIVSRLIQARCGLVAGDLAAADFTLLDGKNAAVAGLFVSDTSTAAEALDKLVAGVGAWYGFDLLNRFRLSRLEAPVLGGGGGTAAVTFRRFDLSTAAKASDLDLVDLDMDSSNSTDEGIPTWKVAAAWGRNWAGANSSPVASVSADRKAWLAAETRTTSASDATVLTASPLASTVELDLGVLVNEADAVAEAARVLAMLKVRRDHLAAKTKMTLSALAALDLGVTGAVVIGRYGYDTGRPVLVTGLQTNAAEGLLDVELWG